MSYIPVRVIKALLEETKMLNKILVLCLIFLVGCSEYNPITDKCSLYCKNTGLGEHDTICFDKKGHAIPNKCSEWTERSEEEINQYYKNNYDWRFEDKIYYQDIWKLTSCDEWVGVFELSHLRNVEKNWTGIEKKGGHNTIFVHPDSHEIRGYEGLGYNCSETSEVLSPLKECVDYTQIALYSEEEIKWIVSDKNNNKISDNQGNWTYKVLEKYCATKIRVDEDE